MHRFSTGLSTPWIEWLGRASAGEWLAAIGCGIVLLVVAAVLGRRRR